MKKIVRFSVALIALSLFTFFFCSNAAHGQTDSLQLVDADMPFLRPYLETKGPQSIDSAGRSAVMLLNIAGDFSVYLTNYDSTGKSVGIVSLFLLASPMNKNQLFNTYTIQFYGSEKKLEAVVKRFYRILREKENSEPPGVPYSKNNRLLPLPLDSKDSVYLNFGVVHMPGVSKPTDMAYSDTVLANIFFEMLLPKVDPNKVVLVVEYPVYIKTEDQIESGQCIWITSAMKKMGFTKWVAADKRSSTTFEYMRNLNFLAGVMRQYYMSETIKNTADTFGFPKVSMKQVKEIPTASIDSIKSALLTVVSEHSFEKDLHRICMLLRKQGYVPVVIAGRDHVLALSEPCLVQVPSSQEEALKSVYTSLYSLRMMNLFKEDFFKKYNLRVKKK